MKLKLITLIAGLTSSLLFAQTEPYYSSPTSSGSFFIGASYGFASDGEADGGDVSDGIFLGDDIGGLNAESLTFIEFGYEHKLDKLTLALSGELFFGDGEGSGFDSFGDSVEYSSENFGVLLNGKVGFNPVNNLTLYAGLGIGSVTNDFAFADLSNGIFIGGEQSLFIYQFSAGIEYKPIDLIGFFAQFRYIGGEDFEEVNFTAIDDSFTEVGIRFHF